MDFRNRTSLLDTRLYPLILRHTEPFDHSAIRVRFKHSRGAQFSGSCYYRTSTLNVNISPRNSYPYALSTHVARPQSNATHWWRELYELTLADAYQLALFIYLHELCHYLIKRAGRSVKRREGACDRFAARVLIDQYGCPLRDSHGREPPRDSWDILNFDSLLDDAPRATEPRPPDPPRLPAPPHERLIPVRIVGLPLFDWALQDSARRPDPQGRTV